ncbi:MAG: flagellar filament capping protein FliD [Butyrivibrio sp.]|nr:flagellar filament capping protein FliD [Ruminococcus flavefaciens]MCM1560237.1 flagellar filament capping protein FliD [Butyrivibrio sp.]
MAMRLSGLMSGMDTESIVQQLVEAKSTKVTKVKNDKTKLEWKQEIWKGLNSKLKTLQSKLNDLRFSSGYTKKTTKVSNENAVSVLTSDNAVNGVQELEIHQLAKTAYMTGGTVSLKEGISGAAVSNDTIMGNLLDFNEGETKSLMVTIGSGDDAKTSGIDITSTTTVSDVLTQLKNAGLNANFDAAQKRFYISAKESGTAGNFEIQSATRVLNGTGEPGDELKWEYEPAPDNGVLGALGLSVGKVIDGENTSDGLGGAATMIKGQDAKITLNGVEYTNSHNSFEINGLTITANSKTNDGEKITLTTQQDTDGIYDKIKDFLKTYNEVINEMDKLYNADAAKDYEPLSDEEKSTMSDTEVEKYEQKIKDSLLRRDSSISAVSSELKKIMMSGFTVNGKTMVLANFGIETLDYFSAPDNERNAYHIYGDPDDSSFADKTDKLKAMIASDPDSVVSFFSQLTQSLYTKMNEQSQSIEGYRSFGSFYDDKKMKSDFDDYKKKVKEQEDKLADYEDKWYAKFAAMETAMAKMQQNASAITGLLGGSQ